VLDDLQALSDLFLISASAVPAEQKFNHVGRNRVLTCISANEILSHQVSVVDRGGLCVKCVERNRHEGSPTVVGLRSRMLLPRSTTTTTAAAPSCLSSLTT